MNEVRVIGGLDATFAWDGTSLRSDAELTAGEPPAMLRGAVATVAENTSGNRWRVVRDPLGLNKLFWLTDASGDLVFAARPWALIDQGHGLDEIASVPRGLVVDLDPSEPEVRTTSLLPEAWSAGAPADEIEIEAAGMEIRGALDRYLAALAARHRGAAVFVCLSGGLDSSGIATLVAEHFPDAVAVSFDLAKGGGDSEDRLTAVRLARELGLSMLEATVTVDELLEPLDTVLRDGIDWRDFNVHAALVNAALATVIADARADGERPLVFTGDLANEFLIDYEAEHYGGKTYYALPRLEPEALRSFLVRGLDTCHREVGVFAAWDLSLIQPYAVAVDIYMRLPARFLRLEDRKQRLCQAIFGNRIPDYVLSRPKARAQVGGVEQAGGVLAAFVDRGLDSAFLRRRFAELHGVGDERAVDRFIRAGRYRARAPSFMGAAGERA